ncbi:type II toxin-antitoxin system RelE/ParE family toxin [uncultured Porphyromonas sp.]|uniref:type II toxin-antitoxin system RelE/ParE family toxin n=1 Tax=uncultured Porphyromonas sp. TaxID=159274 RepID=UPI002805CCC1|nr:type II toxin-antitoxin system RelE/ParE family toxin [uncultured Porphyromonas sp.]
MKTYGGYFQAFTRTLDKEVLRKIDYLLQLLKSEERLSSRFVKLIRDGLFELRISAKGNIYRLFFIFDEGDIVILLNGFQKKTQKTPRKEIDKALKIKEMYYADKQSQD